MATSDRSDAAPATVPTFKLILRDDIRRWTPAGPFTFDTIVDKVVDLFGFPAADAAASLKFLDPEGDKQVTLASNQDLAELLQLNLPVARVFVVEPSSAPPSTPPVGFSSQGVLLKKQSSHSAAPSKLPSGGEGSWKPSRLDRYLANLSHHLAKLSRDDQPSIVRMVKMLTRGAVNTDEAGQERILRQLRRSAEEHPLVKELLSTFAYSPADLGFKRPHIPGRAVAMKALGGDVSQLPPAGNRCFGPRNKCRGPGGKGRRHGFNSKQEKPHLRLVSDVTVPDETRVAPGQSFTKVWRVANSGDLPWDPEGNGLVLLHVAGDSLGAKASTPQCAATGPPANGETADLSVQMMAPTAPGRYEGFFRLARAATSDEEKPMRFGQRIWARIVVDDPAAPVSPVIEGMAGLQVLPSHD